MHGPEAVRGHSQVLPGGVPVAGRTNGKAGQAIRAAPRQREPREQQAMPFQRDAALARNAPSPAAIFSFSASTDASPDALGSERAWVQTPEAPGSTAFDDNGRGNPPNNDISLDAREAITGAQLDPRPPCGAPDALLIEVGGVFNRIVVECYFAAD